MTISQSKRFLSVLISAFLLVATCDLSSYAATAKKLRIANQIEISFPAVQKLSKTGCTSLPVRVKLNKNFDSEAQVTIYIEDDISRTVAFASWFGEEVQSLVNQKTLQGTLKVKLCRDLYYDYESDQEIYPTYKGNNTLSLIFDGSDYKEISTPIKLSE